MNVDALANAVESFLSSTVGAPVRITGGIVRLHAIEFYFVVGGGLQIDAEDLEGLTQQLGAVSCRVEGHILHVHKIMRQPRADVRREFLRVAESLGEGESAPESGKLLLLGTNSEGVPTLIYFGEGGVSHLLVAQSALAVLDVVRMSTEEWGTPIVERSLGGAVLISPNGEMGDRPALLSADGLVYTIYFREKNYQFYPYIPKWAD